MTVKKKEDKIHFAVDYITDRKKAEKELARLASYPELNPNPVLEIDDAGRVHYLNPAAKDLLGTEKPSRHPFLTGVPEVLGNRADVVREVKIGDYWYVQAIHNVPGSNRIRIYARDITDRKRAEEELNLYRQNLERMVEARAAELMAVNRRLRKEIANREKMEDEMLKVQKLESVGILAGGIAHDFNNVLTAIMNSVSTAKLLLKAGKESDKVLQTLDAALKTVRRATTMTYQLLTFAEGGEPVRKVAYVRNLVADTAEVSLRGSNVKCEFRFADDLWPAYIDEGQIVQVLSNLVINADQSMPEGGAMEVAAENVEVKVDDSMPLETGKYIKLTVRDHGAGIHKKNLPKIFDPYFTTKQGGSGLGLASAYSIAKKHGGTITVESKVGSGTAFYVYLPASGGKVIKEEHIEGSDFRSARILLMDDEEDVRDSVASALSLHGFEAEIAEDGTGAVKAYIRARKSGKPFDAIVMDLTVRGGMGGIEAVREIQKTDPDVKAVVVSGYSNNPVMADFKKYGFVGALKKPFEIKELSRVLQEAIAGKSRQGSF